MAYTYEDYVNAKKTNGNNVKVGYFKLENDGDEAIVRLDVSSTADIVLNDIHSVANGNRWIKVSCLKPLGSAASCRCPLCEASQINKSIGKAKSNIYVRALASYRDRATGTWSQAVPVVIERPAAFSKQITGKLRDCGDLRGILFKITRNGAKNDIHTTYTLDYAMPAEVYPQSMIPADFSAFNYFDVAKHSFYNKTLEEINTFVTTGMFPEVAKETPAASQPANNYAQAAQAATQRMPEQPSAFQPSAPSAKDVCNQFGANWGFNAMTGASFVDGD